MPIFFERIHIKAQHVRMGNRDHDLTVRRQQLKFPSYAWSMEIIFIIVSGSIHAMALVLNLISWGKSCISQSAVMLRFEYYGKHLIYQRALVG